MPKLQYNSDDEVVKSNSDNEISEIIQEVKQQKKEKKVYKEVVKEPPKEVVVKEKKPRSERQIEVTNRMREQLKMRRENDIKIKQQAKLEYEQQQKDLKKKIKKLTLKGEVEKKIKTNS